jgi:hypothetical protein
MSVMDDPSFKILICAVKAGIMILGGTLDAIVCKILFRSSFVYHALQIEIYFFGKFNHLPVLTYFSKYFSTLR